MTERKATKIEAGSDMHLTLLGAPMHWNLLTGQDRADMLAFGRAVWQASRTQVLEEVFALVGELHATQSAPLSTRFLYDSAISAAQDAIRSLATPTGEKV